jgi:hypothetical protein
MEDIERVVICMKKEGKTVEDICDGIARDIGYDDTVSYFDIVDMVEKVLEKVLE